MPRATTLSKTLRILIGITFIVIAIAIAAYLVCRSLASRPFHPSALIYGQPASTVAMARLEEQRASLLSQWDSEIKDYPALKEAIAREEATSFDGSAARQAVNWVVSQSKMHPDANQKYEALLSLYTLNAILEMLAEPYGTELVQPAICDRKLMTPFTSRITDALLQELPDVSRTDLADSQKIWQTLTSRSALLNTKLADTLRTLPTDYGWPAAIIQSLSSEQESRTRVDVYQFYQETHIPPALAKLREQFRSVNQQIAALRSTTRP